MVDNASSDASVSVLRREYPEVQVISLPTNRGYSGGSNAGIRAARGEILVMLNNDTEPHPRWLEELIDALDRHPEAGSAASRMMIHDQPNLLHSAGDIYRANGIPDSRGVRQPYGSPFDQEGYVFGGCGGADAYRRKMLDVIGLFEAAARARLRGQLAGLLSCLRWRGTRQAIQATCRVGQDYIESILEHG